MPNRKKRKAPLPPEGVRSPGVPDPDDVQDALRNDHQELFDNNPVLERALNRVPHAWEVLGIQESLRRLAEPLDADTPFEPSEVEKLFDRLGSEGSRKDLYTPKPTDKAILIKIRTHMVKRYVQYLEEEFGMGFQFDRKKLLVTYAPDGGSPKTFWSTLEKTLRDEIRRDHPDLSDIEIRRRASPLLQPFFAKERADPDGHSKLGRIGYAND